MTIDSTLDLARQDPATHAAYLMAAAQSLLAANQEAKAKPLLMEVLQLRQSEHGEDHPETVAAMETLARLQEQTQAHPQAKALYQQALTIRQRHETQGPALTAAYHNLARVHHALAEYDQALPLYEKVVALDKKGPSSPEAATTLHNLAALHQAMGNWIKARNAYQKALDLRQQALAPTDPEVLTTQNHLAILLRTMGKYPEARELFEQVLAGDEPRLGANHPEVAVTRVNLAGIIHAQGDTELAARLYQQALPVLTQTLGQDHPTTQLGLKNYGLLRTQREQQDRFGLELRPPEGKKSGIRVEHVRPSGPADQAGLQTGDVILTADGMTLKHPAQLAMGLKQANGKVVLETRRGRKKMTMTLGPK